jgi:hypothetical protein
VPAGRSIVSVVVACWAGLDGSGDDECIVNAASAATSAGGRTSFNPSPCDCEPSRDDVVRSM